MKQGNGVEEPSGRIDLAREAEFRIGRMLVRPSHREVQVDGQTSVLEPRVMQVLVALAAARPAVLSRDRLIELCWDGRLVGDDAINRCIVELRHLSGKSTPPPFTIENVRGVGYFLKAPVGPAAPEPSSRNERSTWLVAGILIIAVVAAVIFRQFANSQGPMEVRVEGQGPGVDRTVVREAVESAIGMMPSIASVVRATDQGGDGQLTLASNDGGRTFSRVHLSLRSTEPISHDFISDGQNSATLEQAAHYSAVLLGCATTYRGHEEGLKAGELKALIDVCLANRSGERLLPTVLTTVRNIAQRYPEWQEAWAAVLLADWQSYDEADSNTRSERAIQADVEEARRHFPNLAEIAVMEARLLPIGDIAGRFSRRERAMQQHPENDLVVSEWAQQQSLLGFRSKSILFSRQLVKMEPFAPTARAGLAIGLAMDGKLDAGMAELKAADRLWPSREASDAARFLIGIRLGEPKVAQSMVRRGWEPYTGQLTSAFVQARDHPTPAKIDRAIRQSKTAADAYPANDYLYAQALAEFDRTDALYDFLMSPKLDPRTSHVSTVFFRPAFRDLHHDRRFMSVLARFGILPIYQKIGEWPDFCFDSDLPYDCREEALRAMSGKLSSVN